MWLLLLFSNGLHADCRFIYEQLRLAITTMGIDHCGNMLFYVVWLTLFISMENTFWLTKISFCSHYSYIKNIIVLKLHDILAKHCLVKNYVEVNFRGEMVWMFWLGYAWINFSVTPYSISVFWVLLIVSAFSFLPMPCDIYWTINHVLASRCCAVSLSL